MLSVLMATHNGADTIDRTLAAMCELDPPQGGWKLVVVNNASTDDTEARVLEWRHRLPMEYVVEPALGKSAAMNTAFDHADGDFIVMTDDDVLPDRDWLVEWRRVADAYPECSVFGGAIIPHFDAASPRWNMADPWLTLLYGQTPVRPEGEIEPVDVSGGNMAIRRSVLEEGWRFGDAFMVGANGLMGEDADFVKRLAASGNKVAFAPSARIHHIIHEQQISWWWIQRRFFRHGRTMFMLEEVRRNEAPERWEFIFPRWRFLRALKTGFKVLLATVSLDRNRTFALSRALAYDLGALKQAMVLSRRQAPSAGRAK